jgi:hypothetical protein
MMCSVTRDGSTRNTCAGVRTSFFSCGSAGGAGAVEGLEDADGAEADGDGELDVGGDVAGAEAPAVDELEPPPHAAAPAASAAMKAIEPARFRAAALSRRWSSMGITPSWVDGGIQPLDAS